MAEIQIPVTVTDSRSKDSRKQCVLWAKGSITSGDSISFSVGFLDETGTVNYKPLKNSDGELEVIEDTDNIVVLDFNCYDIRAFYTGDSVPADLKVYKS